MVKVKKSLKLHSLLIAFLIDFSDKKQEPCNETAPVYRISVNYSHRGELLVS